MSVRTRFAPSPTGYLHVGGARTALFNWLFARKHGGVFVLRVEDTDKARNTAEAYEAIYDSLSWLGMDWDEGPAKDGPHAPYFQGQRQNIYDSWFEKLVRADRVYESEGAWRFRFERKPITMNDLVCGEVTIDYRDESNTPDMVVKRSDGSYVFHFVNVVDDLEMQISHVIRGEDHLMNTPKHLQLIEAFGGTAPQYAHIPLILNADGSKMSKRDAGAAVGDYPRQGFLPQAVVNFLALLGWNPKTDEEIFSMEALIDRFSIENINRAPARFDLEKCKWFNQQHITKLSGNAFLEAAKPFISEPNKSIQGWENICKLVQPRIKLLSELDQEIENIRPYEKGMNLSESLKQPPRDTLVYTALKSISAELINCSANYETPQAAKSLLIKVSEEYNLKLGQIMYPTRLALTTHMQGPDLGDLITTIHPAPSGRYIADFAEDYCKPENLDLTN